MKKYNTLNVRNYSVIDYICICIAGFMMESRESLQEWVDSKMLRGQYVFTKDDILAIGLPISEQALSNSLLRLGKRGIIISPWQNFYVTVPTEYRLKGIVPPSFYMDRLMKFLNRDYYVSLLTAAAMNGAGHQRAMLFQVTVNGGCIRSGVKNGTRLQFTVRNLMPLNFVHQVKTQNGYMNVSDVELTALDIIAEEKKIGGLSRAAEVLTELAEGMKWDNSRLPLLDFFTSAVIQRLGYLLDLIEEHERADSLFGLLVQSGRTLRRIPLKQSMPVNADMSVNNRWKVIENYELEIDEI